MQIVSFCDWSKWPQMICLLILLSIFSSGCSNESNQVESDVIAFQASVDSLLEEVVIPMQTKIDSQITLNTSMGKDTFLLARQRIPITKVQFLISNEYYILDSILEKYRKHKVTTEDLRSQLNNSEQRVDSLVFYSLDILKNSEN